LNIDLRAAKEIARHKTPQYHQTGRDKNRHFASKSRISSLLMGGEGSQKPTFKPPEADCPK
jgi:hypothetical protein